METEIRQGKNKFMFSTPVFGYCFILLYRYWMMGSLQLISWKYWRRLSCQFCFHSQLPSLCPLLPKSSPKTVKQKKFHLFLIVNLLFCQNSFRWICNSWNGLPPHFCFDFFDIASFLFQGFAHQTLPETATSNCWWILSCWTEVTQLFGKSNSKCPKWKQCGSRLIWLIWLIW